MTFDGSSRHPVLTPARFVCAVAAAAVAGNMYLLLEDALTARQAATRSNVPSSVEAARGYLPGERWGRAEAPRRQAR